MTTYTFYCDESGNSGANYIDPRQPFYVAAGWLVPTDSVAELEELVAREQQAWSPQSSELKAARILRRPSGARFAQTLMRKLGQGGAIPVFTVAEKRFCTAAKIVETYLDPFHNKLLSNTFTCDSVTKTQLANDLCRLLSRQTLNDFADAYRTADPTGLSIALDKIISEATPTLGSEVATLLAGARSVIQEIATAEGWQAGGDLHGINVPALASLFQLLEGIGRAARLEIAKFIHDESATHEDAYHRMFMTYRAVGARVLRMPLGDVSVSGLHAVKAFEMVRSTESRLVQAADLLSGVIHSACRDIDSATKIDSERAAVYALALSPMVASHEPPLVWAMLSNEFLCRLSRTLGWGAPPASDVLPPAAGAVLPASATGRAPLPSGRAVFPADPWLLRDAAGRPVLVRGSADDPTGVLPLFSNPTSAAAFVNTHVPGDDVNAVRAGETPHALLLTFEDLERTLPSDTLVSVDPSDSAAWKLLPLSGIASSIRSLMDRSLRAAATGLMPLVQQVHVVAGRRYITLLLSTGEYGAQSEGSTDVHTADTRDAALALAVARTSGRPGEGAAPAGEAAPKNPRVGN